jgi:hypothetical protein
MSNSVHIHGINELNKLFKELPNVMKDKEARAEMRRQYRPVQREMQRRAGKKTGNLSRSIKFKNGSFKPHIVDVWLGVQNKNRRASHWHIVHEGTDSRPIDGSRAKSKTKAKLKTNAKGEKGIHVKINNSQVVFVTNTGSMPAKKYSEVDISTVLKPANDRMLRNREKAVMRKIQRLKKKYKI